MGNARCDLPGKLQLYVRRGSDGQQWLDSLTEQHVGYSLAHAIWRREPDASPRQLVELHVGFVGENVSMALVTVLTPDACDFPRRHHTCCSRMSNKLNGRPRGTVWDNGGLHVYDVLGWEGALQAIGQIAAVAAVQTGTNDPYRCETFFGPRRWGDPQTYPRPTEGLSDRTVLPLEATLALIEPDVRPHGLSRGELIHEAEAAIDAAIAAFVEQHDLPLRQVRPFHRRKHGGELPEMTVDSKFIGPTDLVEPAAREFRAWSEHYTRCRDEFPDRQDVAFPAGTIRFRRLGAACDPCKPHRRPPCPPRSRPFRGPPPPVWTESDRPTAKLRAQRGPPA